MTGFLASVSSVEEARLVRSLGADVIDLKDPARGALGALDEDSVRAIASLPDSNTMLSAHYRRPPGLCRGTGDRHHRHARLWCRYRQGRRV